MLIISHRSNCKDNPYLENSIDAAKFALKTDSDGIEVDINLSLDGELVVYHDLTTGRFFTQNLKIRKTLYKDLLGLALKNEIKHNYKNFRIPLFTDFIKILPPNKIFIIELKGKLIKKMIDDLKIELDSSSLTYKNIRLIGFDILAMEYAKKVFPTVECNLLADFNKKKFDLNDFINDAKIANLDGVDLSASKIVNSKMIETIKSNGLGLNFYVDSINTKNKSLLMQTLKYNPDSITTDLANLLYE